MTGLSVPTSQIWNWSGNSQGLKTLLMDQWKVSEKNKPAGNWLIFAIQRAVPESEHVQEPQTELSNIDLPKFLSKKSNFLAETHEMFFSPQVTLLAFDMPVRHSFADQASPFSWVGPEASIFGDRSFLYPFCGRNFHQQYYHHWEKRLFYTTLLPAVV